MGVAPKKKAGQKNQAQSTDIVRDQASHELFFAVVGPVGAGSSRAADALTKSLEAQGYVSRKFKASDQIKNWAKTKGLDLPAKGKSLEAVTIMQNYGDDFRSEAKDNAVIAIRLIGEIAEQRAKWQNSAYVRGRSVAPNQGKRAYIIDSLKHPAEAELLRRVYGSAFCLIGVVCSEAEREKRIIENFYTAQYHEDEETIKLVRKFMERDASDEEKKFGQHVTDAFHMADFFVDNSEPDKKDKHHFMNDAFGRLIDILSHTQIHRPNAAETAMHVAYSASLRSSCLSRQVGAALADDYGNVIATGTNEVPKAGGGVYGEEFRHFEEDGRCFIKRCCSNNAEQNDIIEDLINKFPEILAGSKEEAIEKIRKRTRIGGLIEFSRAIHAEMDAILSAARVGSSPVGGRLFVTTFPCHYCARHIVSAGICEVQYIEPYPKSRALALHADAIETEPALWYPPSSPAVRNDEVLERKRREHKFAPPPKPGDPIREPVPIEKTGKVLFRPFVGVAPRMYPRAFLKDRDYKNKVTGQLSIKDPEWGSQWGLHRVSYHELEARLTIEADAGEEG